MGMDVYGKNPKSEVGEYFRNNVWYWRPLWMYICETHPDLVGEAPEYGFSNSGYGLGAEGAARLGKALEDDIRSGRVADYQSSYYAHLAELPREDCPHCQATGIRSDEIGVRQGMTIKELDPEVAAFTGRTHGWCNGCHGMGTTEHFALNYPFEVGNVEEFALFLLDSGGFAIH